MIFNITATKIIDYILIIAIASVIILLANVYIKNQAMDGCAKSSTYTQTLPDQNAVASYPIAEMYKKCLLQKGIK